MLYRVEHAWLVWLCKIKLSHYTFKAPLLSPLEFSMENQQPKFQNSLLKCQAKADEDPACVWMCVRERDREGGRESFRREQRKSCRCPVFPKPQLQCNEPTERDRANQTAEDVWRVGNSTWVFFSVLPTTATQLRRTSSLLLNDCIDLVCSRTLSLSGETCIRRTGHAWDFPTWAD